MVNVGLDVGSVAVKAVVLKDKTEISGRYYVRHLGNPVSKAIEVLDRIRKDFPGASISITGSSGDFISNALALRPVNEVIAQGYSTSKLYPEVRTIIEMGGEDSKLIILEGGAIKEFSMNSVCAAGTGSFLEQQAERLNLSIEEFAHLAEKSRRPSKIAGRCSVFAKSDMIHLQQIATPVEDIVAGLCFAVARNFKGSIAKGIDMVATVSFQGGVAANSGMVRAFREVLDIPGIFIPQHFYYMGALGAVLKDVDDGRTTVVDLAEQLSLLDKHLNFKGNGPKSYPRIGSEDFYKRHLNGYNNIHLNINGIKPAGNGSCVNGNGNGRHDDIKPRQTQNNIKAFLGIDIGSISTNLVLIDDNGQLLAKRYLMTAGRPIEAVMQGLQELHHTFGNTLDIRGVGTTGSGRYMIADFVGADVVKNEITAQARAAVFIDPSVDTIFEIGGQDSKYISIKNGAIVDFEMNKACAAGTGSFIEEQAEKLGISVKQEFASAAFKSDAPCPLGERCTVFMENSLMSNLQRGARIDDLLAGLSYSIAQNYINRVVAGKPVGKTIFFQGGVAFNKAVIAAFEQYLGKDIIVPPNHDVTGAIGMALIARENEKKEGSSFKGFEVSKRDYKITSFECNSCSNVCEINRVKIEDEKNELFYGGRCEKFDVNFTKKNSLPDLFAFREEMLWKAHKTRLTNMEHHVNGKKQATKIGIPYIFYFQDFLPFWSTFLWELGFDVVISPKTNKAIINLGLENIFSEACFPVKVAHGHIKHLKDAGVDLIFLPSFIGLNDGNSGTGCPYVQTISYVSNVALGNQGSKLVNSSKNGKPDSPLKPIARADEGTISPKIDFTRGDNHVINELAKAFGGYASRSKITRAMEKAHVAQGNFKKAIKEKGREVLESLRRDEKAVVVIGRSYNAFDPGINLDIPKKLNQLDTISIPLDFLPLEGEKLDNSYNMYWYSGQKILKAAKIISKTPQLYPIFIGNFSCGPDSFILKYFRKELGNKPFLHLEIDEHSATAGAITRCEAFLDSIGNSEASNNAGGLNVSGKPLGAGLSGAKKEKVIYIPRMSDHAFALAAAFNACGVKSELLPEPDMESVELGKKYVSGKECYPYLLTAGDMLKKILSPGFDRSNTAFFMPSGSGPCRFGQYNVSHRLVLDKAGYGDVPVFSPNQDDGFYRDLGIVGNSFVIKAWKGVMTYELLIKSLHETRPYEIKNGSTDELYQSYLQQIYDYMVANKELEGLLKIMSSEFAALKDENIAKKPVIGVVGEIYVRSNKFSNEDVIRKIEAFGAEAWLSPMPEWIFYMNRINIDRALVAKDWPEYMGVSIKNIYQKKIEKKFGKSFHGILRSLEEPKVTELFKKASPFIHRSFEGEAILSIGKAIDFIEKGATGVINVMPFGCMPGTIVTALFKAVSKKYGVPCISIPYDGTESSSSRLQLEAFVEAAKSGHAKVSNTTTLVLSPGVKHASV